MRLSRAESGAIGSSGSASESTSSSSSRSSRPPSFTRSSATTVPVTRHRRLGGQARDRLVELARRLVLRQHHLREARFVANDHELHPLLVAHGLHPAADRHPLADLRRAARRSASASRRGPYPSRPSPRARCWRATPPPPRRARPRRANSGASTRVDLLDRARLEQVVRLRARAPRRRSAVSRTSTRAHGRAHRARAPGTWPCAPPQHVGRDRRAPSPRRSRSPSPARRPAREHPSARRLGPAARGAPSPPATTTTPPR